MFYHFFFPQALVNNTELHIKDGGSTTNFSGWTWGFYITEFLLTVCFCSSEPVCMFYKSFSEGTAKTFLLFTDVGPLTTGFIFVRVCYTSQAPYVYQRAIWPNPHLISWGRTSAQRNKFANVSAVSTNTLYWLKTRWEEACDLLLCLPQYSHWTFTTSAVHRGSQHLRTKTYLVIIKTTKKTRIVGVSSGKERDLVLRRQLWSFSFHSIQVIHYLLTHS